jgi:hypothetical protein
LIELPLAVRRFKVLRLAQDFLLGGHLGDLDVKI